MHFPVDCNITIAGVTLGSLRKAKQHPEPETEYKPMAFSKSLASVLSASPKQIQDAHAQASDDKFSSHSRYKLVPSKRP
jgi:hypothetical protein